MYSPPDLTVSNKIVSCLSALMVAITQPFMSYCSPVSDQEEDENEPEPPQPFEWTEFCCSPVFAMPGQEDEGDEPEPPQPFEWTED